MGHLHRQVGRKIIKLSLTTSTSEFRVSDEVEGFFFYVWLKITRNTRLMVSRSSNVWADYNPHYFPCTYIHGHVQQFCLSTFTLYCSSCNFPMLWFPMLRTMCQESLPKTHIYSYMFAGEKGRKRISIFLFIAWPGGLKEINIVRYLSRPTPKYFLFKCHHVSPFQSWWCKPLGKR